MKSNKLGVSTVFASCIMLLPGAVWALLLPTNVLKAAGVDDEGVAQAYYATIDPDDLRTTQDDWEEVNGFNDPVNTIVDVRGYKNDGDLGFWRSIEMVRDKRRGKRGNIAVTTVNYNSEADSLSGANQVSIVNMEFSQGPDEDDLVKFYVYAGNQARNEGERLTSTPFPAREPGRFPGDTVHYPASGPFYVPAGCYSCHGGDDDATSPMPPSGYNEGSGETNANFLAFDINTFKFGDTSQASLEAGFKKLNKAVLRADPTSATKTLIKGLYGGKGLPRDTQDLGYIPDSWEGEEPLYTQVVVPSCRLCHTTSDSKVLSLEWWQENPDKIREEVFHELTMPNSPNGYYRFWNSDEWMVLSNALDRFEQNL
jgi:hypothetical protein